MRREWEPKDLVGAWTLVADDWRPVGNKTGHTRLGFVLLLKFFELEGRFPRYGGELPPAAVAYAASQVRVDRLVRRVRVAGTRHRIPPGADPRRAGLPPGNPRRRGAHGVRPRYSVS